MPLEISGSPVNGVDEVEIITPGATITGGTFTITYGGQTTAAIAAAATSAQIQAALEALSNVAPGDIVVTGGPVTAGAVAGVVTLSFKGNLGGLNVSQVTVDATNLTGAAHTLTPSTTTAGVQGSYRGARTGAVLDDTTGGVEYRNTGTPQTPIWTVTTAPSPYVQRLTRVDNTPEFVDRFHSLERVTT